MCFHYTSKSTSHTEHNIGKAGEGDHVPCMSDTTKVIATRRLSLLGADSYMDIGAFLPSTRL